MAMTRKSNNDCDNKFSVNKVVIMFVNNNKTRSGDLCSIRIAYLFMFRKDQETLENDVTRIITMIQ